MNTSIKITHKNSITYSMLLYKGYILCYFEINLFIFINELKKINVKYNKVNSLDVIFKKNKER